MNDPQFDQLRGIGGLGSMDQLDDMAQLNGPDMNDFGEFPLNQANFDEPQPPQPQMPPPPVYNMQPPMGMSVTTPATVPQAYAPQQLPPRQPNSMLGSGVKGSYLLQRVEMALRSGVQDEVDWSIATMLNFTTGPSLDMFRDSPAVFLLIGFIHLKWSEITSSQTEEDDSYDVLWLRQKVLEAVLIVRNLCVDPGIAESLAPQTVQFVESGIALPQASIYTELRLLCLEICEHVCFHYPNASSDSSLSRALAAQLNSPDKSVVVSACRSFARLSVFDSKDAGVLPITAATMQKLVRYLLIDDTDLIAAVLDLLCQYIARLQRVDQINVITNPSWLSQHLIRLLSFRMDHEPIDYLRLPRRTRRPAPVVPPEIPQYILSELLTLSEPERATMWIRSSYDTDPEGEVLQVSLWSSYQRLFEQHERDGTGKKLLKAIDFIRTCTTNVRGAQAKVVTTPDDSKKFIIKGLVPREKAVPPSVLLMNQQPQQPQDEADRSRRLAPVYAHTAAIILQNLAKLQGGKDLLKPLISSIVEAGVLNPGIMDQVDRLLGEVD